jgi:hypothetical protein
MGRGVRNCKVYQNAIDHCYFYYPNFSLFTEVAETLEAGYKHFVTEEIDRCFSPTGRSGEPKGPKEAFLFDEITGGDYGIINNGYHANEQEKEMINFLKDKNYPMASILENMIARNIQKDEPQGNNKLDEIPKYEKVRLIKKEVHKRIGYAIRLGIYTEYQNAHYKYNEAANIKDQKTCMDLRLLNKKFIVDVSKKHTNGIAIN